MLADRAADQLRVLCKDVSMPIPAIIGRVEEFMVQNVKDVSYLAEQRRYEDKIHDLGTAASRPAFPDSATQRSASWPAARDIDVRRHLDAHFRKARTDKVGGAL